MAPGNQKGRYFCGGSILKITLKCVILEAGLLKFYRNNEGGPQLSSHSRAKEFVTPQHYAWVDFTISYPAL